MVKYSRNGAGVLSVNKAFVSLSDLATEFSVGEVSQLVDAKQLGAIVMEECSRVANMFSTYDLGLEFAKPYMRDYVGGVATWDFRYHFAPVHEYLGISYRDVGDHVIHVPHRYNIGVEIGNAVANSVSVPDRGVPLFRFIVDRRGAGDFQIPFPAEGLRWRITDSREGSSEIEHRQIGRRLQIDEVTGEVSLKASYKLVPEDRWHVEVHATSGEQDYFQAFHLYFSRDGSTAGANVDEIPHTADSPALVPEVIADRDLHLLRIMKKLVAYRVSAKNSHVSIDDTNVKAIEAGKCESELKAIASGLQVVPWIKTDADLDGTADSQPGMQVIYPTGDTPRGLQSG